MTPDTITTKLYAAADEKLKADVAEAFDRASPFMRLLLGPRHDGIFQIISVPGRISSVYHEGVEVRADQAIEKLKALAFKNNQISYREAAVEEFMDKIKQLSADVEDLQNRIQ